MSKTLFRLYPPPYEAVSLRGLYLQLALQERGTREQPLVYANFLTSLDGRIALVDATGEPYLPKSLTTPDDFRLFLELECQADCLITHGGYLRALAAEQLGNILQIGAHPLGADLVDWRQAQGLSAQPAVVIASASLDFPMPALLRAHEQPCYIATGETADPARVANWRRQGFEVFFAGRGALVEGAALTRRLAERGYRTLYLIAGPHMLDTMVRESQLALLFQTITHQLTGGKLFRSLVPGAELGAAGHLRMASLYYDPVATNGAGQWFACFECPTQTP